MKELRVAIWLPGKPQKKSYKFFCRGLDIRVSQIVDPNAFYAGFLTATLHFPIQIAFCDREHPVVQTNVVLHLQIPLHFICQKACIVIMRLLFSVFGGVMMSFPPVC